MTTQTQRQRSNRAGHTVFQANSLIESLDITNAITAAGGHVNGSELGIAGPAQLKKVTEILDKLALRRAGWDIYADEYGENQAVGRYGKRP